MNIDITYKGVDINVVYDYYPEQKEVRYNRDGSGTPGAPEEVRINDITFAGASLFELLEDQFDDIEILIINQGKG